MSIGTDTEGFAEHLLPDSYDRLVAVDKLVHGEYNPRRVHPSSSLRRSIADDGIDRPLIVRPDDERDLYHITDGWQRYQAATACGWEALPVKIYESALEALKATESASIVREWSTYEWAQYCRALATELKQESKSRQELVEQIADRTVKSPQTVRQYLYVLSLPEEIYPLLTDGPDGTQQQWAALKNYNTEIRYYGDLWWPVAARLGRKQSKLQRSRVVEIAVRAVEFDGRFDATEFVDEAVDRPEEPVESIQREVLFGCEYDQYLVVPRVAMKLESHEKRAVMDHCRETSQSLSDIIESKIESLATSLMDNQNTD